LADRAQALGFEQVDIIDTDLGRSAAIGAVRREGFERLIAAVAVGEVVLSLEVCDVAHGSGTGAGHLSCVSCSIR
jgi:hypothetical protein